MKIDTKPLNRILYHSLHKEVPKPAVLLTLTKDDKFVLELGEAWEDSSDDVEIYSIRFDTHEPITPENLTKAAKAVSKTPEEFLKCVDITARTLLERRRESVHHVLTRRHRDTLQTLYSPLNKKLRELLALERPYEDRRIREFFLDFPLEKQQEIIREIVEERCAGDFTPKRFAEDRFVMVYRNAPEFRERMNQFGHSNNIPLPNERQ